MIADPTQAYRSGVQAAEETATGQARIAASQEYLMQDPIRQLKRQTDLIQAQTELKNAPTLARIMSESFAGVQPLAPTTTTPTTPTAPAGAVTLAPTTPTTPQAQPDQQFNSLMGSYQQLKGMAGSPQAQAAAGALSGRIRQQLMVNPRLGMTQTVDPQTGELHKTEVDPQTLEFKRTLDKPNPDEEKYAVDTYQKHFFELPPSQQSEARQYASVTLPGKRAGETEEAKLQVSYEKIAGKGATRAEAIDKLKPDAVNSILGIPMRGTLSTAARDLLPEARVEYMFNKGITESDIPLIQSNYKALSTTNQKMTLGINQMVAFENTVKTQMGKAKETYDRFIKKYPPSDLKKFNTWSQFVAANVNDPDLAAYGIFMNTIPDEFAKVVIAGGGGTQTAQGDRERYGNSFWNAFKTGTPATFASGLKAMTDEMMSREKEYKKQARSVQGDIRNIIQDPSKLRNMEEVDSILNPTVGATGQPLAAASFWSK